MPELFLNKPSFNGGEIGPSSEGRSDLEQYRFGARRMLNLVPTPVGSARKRLGTRFLANTLSATTRGRLLPFVTKEDRPYLIELGDRKCRFWFDKSVVEHAPLILIDSEIYYPGHQFERQNHGFYHGQPVQVTVSGGGILPTSILGGTTYYVSLLQPFAMIDPVTTVFQVQPHILDHGLYPGTGPFRVFVDEYDDAVTFDPGRELWCAARLSKTTFTAVEGRDTGIAVTGAGSVGHPFMTLPQSTQMSTLRLATDPNDLVGTVLPFTDSGSSVEVLTITPVTVEEIVLELPYTTAELDRVRITQSNDELYLFHGEHPPHVIRHWGDSAFTASLLEFGEEPISNIPPDGSRNWLRIVEKTYAQNTVPLEAGPGWDTKHHFFGVIDVGRTIRKRATAQDADDVATVAQSWAIGRIERLEVDEQGGLHHYTAFQAHAWLLDTDFDAPTDVILDKASLAIDAEDVLWFREFGTGTLPPEIVEGTPYYPVTINAGVDFQISLTKGGAVHPFSAPGAGNRIFVGSSYWRTTDEVGAPVNPAGADGILEPLASMYHYGEVPVRFETGKLFQMRREALGYVIQNRDGSEFQMDTPAYGVLWLSFGEETRAVEKVSGRWHVAPTDNGIALDSAGPIGEWSRRRSKEWGISVWGYADGWPAASALYEERLIVAGDKGDPGAVSASQSGDFTNFSFDDFTPIGDVVDQARAVTASSAFRWFLVGKEQVAIRWLHPGRALFAGTPFGIYEIGSSTDQEALSPISRTSRRVSNEGASEIQAVAGKSEIIYEDGHHRRIIGARVDAGSQFLAQDLTLLAPHVMSSPVRRLTYQEDPHGILYVVLEDGMLWGCTLNMVNNLLAWHEMGLGGADVVVEDAQVIPAPDESYDRLYLMVARTVNSVTVRWVEYLELWPHEEDDSREYLTLDASAARYEGSPITVVTGLTHLEGETVAVWADGGDAGNFVVASGQITLPDAASDIEVGLPYTWLLTTLPMEAVLDTQEQTLIGVTKTIVDLYLRVTRSIGGEVRFENPEDPLGWTNLVLSKAALVMGDPVDLVTGLVEVAVGGHETKELVLEMRGTRPGPIEINAIVGRVHLAER